MARVPYTREWLDRWRRIMAALHWATLACVWGNVVACILVMHDNCPGWVTWALLSGWALSRAAYEGACKHVDQVMEETIHWLHAEMEAAGIEPPPLPPEWVNRPRPR